MFGRVLIANRGEIAVRVARTLRRLGIESVAVYSDADAGAPHVRAADRALRIGPAAAAESYLDVERVVGAAARCGAEALHPGYGFLSERPELSRACAEAGLAFVGPGPEAMALLGDKVAAKRAAEAAGVPVLPGLGAERLSDEEIAAWAEDRELPLLLKAAAGGGGKGMRVVRERGELAGAIAAARREAKAAFGDDRLLAERFVERSRHIEVQILADAHGGAVHLGERECSLQRRHQKVIEEAPSPVVGPELRERMGEAAVALAREAGYVGAGTVELIAEREDPSRFWFLEVNARLQVEHPVTEAVSGLDLVELQLRVAAGEPLPLAQADVELRGCAAEARIYAEDAAAGFLPSTGRVAAYREPGAIRFDSGVEEGSEVTSHYDPMLAKAIAGGPDRGAALARLRAGLGELVLLGPATNVAYLRALLARPEVREGRLDTGLIERLGDAVAPPPPDPALAAVALAELLREGALGGGRTDSAPSAAAPKGTAARAVGDPWEAIDAWRPAGPAWTRLPLASSASPATAQDVAIRTTPANPSRSSFFPRTDASDERERGRGAPPAERSSFLPEGGNKDERGVGGGRGGWEWRVGEDSGRFRWDGTVLEVGGEARALRVFRDGDGVWLLDGDAEPVRFAPARAEDEAGGAAAAGSLEAPMPGTVIDVRAAPGDAVAAGEVLVVLESMKMEMSVQSPGEGTVGEVLVAEGDRVARGDALVTLGSPEGDASDDAEAVAT